ncbi:MAG: hypothetical protein IIB04_03445 [Acidobacteria bacterium]|nr:hypothetical protein [Acidobacteriota bacterium]MCH8985651.1 hypothetical protein [Acidobacteriota bacterium]
MGKRPFTRIAERWIAELTASGLRVRDHRAVVTPRATIVDDLCGGVDVVLYLGHGRARGWNGYQTVRTHHFDRTRSVTSPVSVVLAFACSTLAAPDDGESFGHALVAGGRVKAYVGWGSAIPISPGLRLADRFVAALATRRYETIGALWTAIQAAELDGEERRALCDARLIGETTASLI